MTVRHEGVSEPALVLGRLGDAHLRLTGQSSVKFILTVKTRGEFCVGKNLQNSSGYSKMKTMLSQVRRDLLANARLTAQSWHGCERLRTPALIPSPPFIGRFLPSDQGGRKVG